MSKPERRSRATSRISWRNDGYGPTEAVTRLRLWDVGVPGTCASLAENESVHVKYRFQFPGDTADILPEWEAPAAKHPWFYLNDAEGKPVVETNQEVHNSSGTKVYVADLQDNWKLGRLRQGGSVEAAIFPRVSAPSDCVQYRSNL